MVTVAGPNGSGSGTPGSATYDNLLAAHARCRRSVRRVARQDVSSRSCFALPATSKSTPISRSDKGRGARWSRALRVASLSRRASFGQPVMLSEVISVIQAVPGVVAGGASTSSIGAAASASLQQRLLADLPVLSANGQFCPRELLTLDAASTRSIRSHRHELRLQKVAYELLPAIYRVRDAEAGRAAQEALLDSVIAEQIGVLEEEPLDAALRRSVHRDLQRLGWCHTSAT